MLWARSSSFAESDFHLFESDCIGNEWLLIAGQKVPGLIDEPVPEALQAGASCPAAGRGAPRPPQLWGWEGQRRSQPAERYQTEHIECLSDIEHVYACTPPWPRQCCLALLELFKSRKAEDGQTVLDLFCEHIGGAERQWCTCIPRSHRWRDADAY